MSFVINNRYFPVQHQLFGPFNGSKIARLCVCVYLFIYLFIYIYLQGVSRLKGITTGDDFLGLCDEKSSYKHVSDFGRLRSYDRLKLRIEGNDY